MRASESLGRDLSKLLAIAHLKGENRDASFLCGCMSCVSLCKNKQREK